ncbi:MAG: acyl-CoA/acyl-ACP dehydrogenase [Deltaproteobacteria bacterium]|nr:acyl-CoA/acyl-ACP dehydrogenase [Deltaproteobacteria bacterium]
MDLDFTTEQNTFRESVSRFLANECPFDRVRQLEESAQGYAAELWPRMAELGWLGMSFPEEYGGFGGEFMYTVILQEEIGRACFPSPFFSTVIQCGLTILAGGTEEQKKDLLGKIIDGSLIMALAQYEEEGSYLPSGIQMRAAPRGEQFVLNGTKMFVMDANIAQKLIVVARVDQGITLFVVGADTPGIICTKMPTVGMDNCCRVVFKDVTISQKAVLGQPGKGWEMLDKMAPKATVAKAAEMAGGCKGAIDITVRYAKEREQYGKPIGSYQAIQHFMANMALAYETGWSYLYKVASMVDAGEDFTLEASVLKSAMDENYKFISERACHIHGGIGTAREADIGLFFRRAKAFSYLMGDTEYHDNKVAEAVLKGLCDD